MAAILVLLILMNPSYFQLNALKPGIYRFSGSANLLALSVFLCDHVFSLIFYYWHNVLEAVVSDLCTFGVTASAEGCLCACTVFLLLGLGLVWGLFNECGLYIVEVRNR